MTTGFVGDIFLARATDASPTAFVRVCEVFGIGGVGQTNEQVESTTFCSNGVKEYLAGLADGSEVTLELNFKTDVGHVIRDMINDVKNKIVREFQIQCDGDGDGVVDMTFTFFATCLSWVLNPSVNSKNTINFGLKITGDIAIA